MEKLGSLTAIVVALAGFVGSYYGNVAKSDPGAGRIHDLRARRAGHFVRRDEAPPQTTRAAGVDLAGRRAEWNVTS